MNLLFVLFLFITWSCQWYWPGSPVSLLSPSPFYLPAHVTRCLRAINSPRPPIVTEVVLHDLMLLSLAIAIIFLGVPLRVHNSQSHSRSDYVLFIVPSHWKIATGGFSELLLRCLVGSTHSGLTASWRVINRVVFKSTSNHENTRKTMIRYLEDFSSSFYLSAFARKISLA